MFARMSTRPHGLGVDALSGVVSGMKRFGLEKRDTPSRLRVGAKMYPIGRYLRRKLHEKLGKDIRELGSFVDPEVSLVQAYSRVSFISAREIYGIINRSYSDGQESRLKVAKAKRGVL